MNYLDKRIILNSKNYFDYVVNKRVKFVLFFWYILIVIVLIIILVLVCVYINNPASIIENVIISVVSGFTTGLILYIISNYRTKLIRIAKGSSLKLYNITSVLNNIRNIINDNENNTTKKNYKKLNKLIKTYGKKFNDNNKSIKIMFSTTFYNDFLSDFKNFEFDCNNLNNYVDLKKFCKKYKIKIYKWWKLLDELYLKLQYEYIERESSIF